MCAYVLTIKHDGFIKHFQHRKEEQMTNLGIFQSVSLTYLSIGNSLLFPPDRDCQETLHDMQSPVSMT